jgi:hypothetical protein
MRVIRFIRLFFACSGYRPPDALIHSRPWHSPASKKTGTKAVSSKRKDQAILHTTESEQTGKSAGPQKKFN